jgi:hypothetical protein
MGNTARERCADGLQDTHTNKRGHQVSSDKDSRAYSVRLSGADLRKLKVISDRLGVTESDLIRFALRNVLNRLSPLHDTETRGATLLPVFVEFGNEMMSYFDLDESSLDRILNDDLTNGRRVDREDIGLLLMSGLEKTRLYARLSELTDEHIEPDEVFAEFKKYLYEKYLFRRSA